MGSVHPALFRKEILFGGGYYNYDYCTASLMRQAEIILGYIQSLHHQEMIRVVFSPCNIVSSGSYRRNKRKLLTTGGSERRR